MPKGVKGSPMSTSPAKRVRFSGVPLGVRDDGKPGGGGGGNDGDGYGAWWCGGGRGVP